MDTRILLVYLLDSVHPPEPVPPGPRAAAYLMCQLDRVPVLREVAGRGEFAFERILRTMDDLLARGSARPRPEPS